MAYYMCQGGSGEGGSAPIFSKTLIASDESLTGTLTFTSDPENYDFIDIVLDTGLEIITTMDVINNIWLYSSNRICLNTPNTNHYVCYSETSSLEWKREQNRYRYVTNIYGLNCINGTVTKTVVYNKQAINSTTITDISANYNSFDFVLFATATGDYTETQVSNYIYHGKGIPLMYENGETFRITKYNGIFDINIEDDNIASFPYAFYILGINVSCTPGAVQAKNVLPDFSNGNVTVSPDSGSNALSYVTIYKDSTLVAENVKKAVSIHGITGTYEPSGSVEYLFEDADLIADEYVDGSSIIPWSGWSRTDYIPVIPGETLSIATEINQGYCSWFGSDKSYISSFNPRTLAGGGGYQQITIPANAYYFIMSESNYLMQHTRLWR